MIDGVDITMTQMSSFIQGIVLSAQDCRSLLDCTFLGVDWLDEKKAANNSETRKAGVSTTCLVCRVAQKLTDKHFGYF